MVDDTTRRDDLDPDDVDLDETDDGRPIIVSLNPPMERVTWQRLLAHAQTRSDAVGEVD